jgi:hypothetical protein
MGQLLNEFEIGLKKSGYQVEQLLNQGLSEEYLDSKTPFLPASAREMYRWRNGMASISGELPLGKRWFFNFGYMPSLETALEIYTTALRMKNNLYIKDYLFPIFESGGGDFYLLDCAKESPTFGMIFINSFGDFEVGEFVSKYDSIQAFVKTAISCFENKVYRYDENGYLESDLYREIEIGYTLNPLSEYWKILKSELLEGSSDLPKRL